MRCTCTPNLYGKLHGLACVAVGCCKGVPPNHSDFSEGFEYGPHRDRKNLEIAYPDTVACKAVVRFSLFQLMFSISRILSA